MINETLELIDELPEEAEEFGESVREKLEDIMGWAEARNHITEGQVAAVENMDAGVRKWLGDAD
jgi:hypothetical protein